MHKKTWNFYLLIKWLEMILLTGWTALIVSSGTWLV